MDADRQNALPPAITGTVIQMSERHMVAFYVRDGRCYVADFREGRGALTDPGTWFRFHAGPLRYCHFRRLDALACATVLTPAIIEQIEQLHRRMEDHAEARGGSASLFAVMQRFFGQLFDRRRNVGSRSMPAD